MLEDGEIKQSGNQEELLKRPELTKRVILQSEASKMIWSKSYIQGQRRISSGKIQRWKKLWRRYQILVEKKNVSDKLNEHNSTLNLGYLKSQEE